MVNLKSKFIWKSMKGVVQSFSKYRGDDIIVEIINYNIGDDTTF